MGDDDTVERNSAEGRGKGKGTAPPLPARPGGGGGGPSQPSVSAAAFKVKAVGASRRKIADRPSRLHMTAGQQLVAAQEPDGHFEAKALAIKLDRLWSKLMISEAPGDPRADLSAHPLDATLFMLRLFERFLDKSGSNEEIKRDHLITWFGSGGLLGDRWLDELNAWLGTHDQSGFWREGARFEIVDTLLDKWFATDADCKSPGSFIDNVQLQARQTEISEKFASSQTASLRRERLWADSKPAANLGAVRWEATAATRWCFGGGGGCFLVRVGDQKLLVKGAQTEGDVLAHELAKMVGVRTAAARFVSPASAEFDLARGALNAARTDEPEHGRRLSVMFANLQKTGCPLMVMEFVSGCSLLDHLGSEALSRGDEELMRSLGRAVAADALVNNWDRMPALRPWPGAGNLGNVLITEEGDAVAIDQAAHLLCEPQARADYYRALRCFAEEVQRARSGGDLGGQGLDRMRKAVQRQVMKWTGDAAKDAERFEQFMIKPESVEGVVLQDTACRFLLEGVEDVFSKIATVRAEFAAKRAAIVDLTRSYFVEVEGGHHAERIDGATLFIEECMGVVEAEHLYEATVHATLEQNIVFPGREYVSSLQ